LSVVLDASAVIALMKAEPGSERVQACLPEAVISVVNLAEVVAVLARGNSPDQVRAAIREIGATPIAADEEMAVDAGLLRAVTDRVGLSLADRFCIVLGRRLSAPILTADRAWARIAAEADVEIELIR
jgi:ribonuclease VapC